MEANPNITKAVPMRTQTVILNESLPRESLSFNHSVVNTTNAHITVMHRNGIAYRIPPTRGIGNTPGIYVTLKIQGTTQVIFDSFNKFNVSDALLDDHVKQLRDSLDKPHMRAFKTMSVSHRISLEELTSMGGTIYDTTLDMVISTSTEACAVGDHPASTRSMMRECLHSNQSEHRSNAFMFNVSIVDNTEHYGDRFINIAGEIYRITAIKDPSLLSGIYLSMSASTNGTNEQYLTFEEFEKHPLNTQLFKTSPEAKALGNVLEAKEKELKEKALEYQQFAADTKLQQLLLEKQWEELKLKEEKDKQKLEDERRMLEHQRAIQSLDRKDHYEHASYSRKDSSEIWKILPVVFTGVLAFATLFKGK